MKVDKEFLLKHQFWIILAVAVVLWLPIFFIAFFGLSGDEWKQNYESEYKKVSGLKDFKNDKFVAELEKKRGSLDERKLELWQTEAAKQRDADEEHLRWSQGTDGLFWFNAMKNWELPVPKDNLEKVQGEKGILAQMKKGDMNAEIDFAFRKNWYDGFYKPQIEEVSSLVAPALVDGDGKDVVYCSQFDVFKTTNKVPDSAQVWLMQEDLVVRREVLRLIHGAVDSLLRFTPTGEFHRMPYASTPHTYQSANWELELVLNAPEKKAPAAAPGAKSGSAGSGSAAPAAAGLFLSPTSKLINIRADQAAASLKDLRLRLSQPRGRAEPILVSLSRPGEPLAFDPSKKKAVKFEELGVKEPIELVNFDSRLPIDAMMVSEGGDSSPTDENVKRLRLRNNAWEVDLLFKKQGNNWFIDPMSRLTNVHAARRKMPVFSLKLKCVGLVNVVKGSGVSNVMELGGDPIAWSLSRSFKDLGVREPIKIELDLDRPDLDHAIELSQEPTTDASPVKKIEDIELGLNSSLTAGVPLVARKSPQAPAASSAPAQPAAGSRGKTSAPGSGEVQAAADGVNLARYLASTDQLRTLPVAIVLVVDQAQVPEVLAALEPANSRLQFVTTLVTWQHVQLVLPEKKVQNLRPADSSDGSPVIPGAAKGSSDEGTGKAGLGRGGLGGAPPGGRGGGTGGGSGIRPGGSPPTGSQGSGSSKTVVEDTAGDPNMVQLLIHGVVKLYEPPSPKVAKPAAGSGAGARGSKS